jgi:membrane associated rhomboid family serine protease
MFFPFGTDAPIYHRPFGTVGLIAVNVLVFVAALAWPNLGETLALAHGRGLTPVTWLTSNFLHEDLIHLLANMLFLWGFGIVIEGKLGWRQFVCIFLLIGVLECALEQLIFRDESGTSLGASAAIFGLMSMCLIWAPRNELHVFYWLFYRAGVIEVPIIWFAALVLAKSVFVTGLTSGASGEVLHLLGAGVGATVGLFMLQTRQVDCEGWDLLTMLRGGSSLSTGMLSTASQEALERRQQSRVGYRRKPSIPKEPTKQQVSTAKFSSLVNQRKPHAALTELNRIRHLTPDWQPTTDEQLALARGLRQLQQFDDAVRMYEEVLQRRPDFSLGRLELAELLVLNQERPAAAKRLLDPCDPQDLSPAQVVRLEALQSRIQQLFDSGVIELEGRAW